MKRASLKFFAGAGVVLGLLAFTTIKEGGITGKVTPADGAKEVIALAQGGTDTLRSEYANGTFSFRGVPKGKYTVWVKGITPYKTATIENVNVDSVSADLGEIKLMQ